jgi:hypothetical protein
VRQLLVYDFGADASFQGALVGALERLQSGGTLKVLDVMFVQRDAETGEVAALASRADVSGMLGFRLDERERARATEKALRDETVRALAARLEPGAAMAAVLIDHVWASVLSDAVLRTGGSPRRDELVEAATLSECLAPAAAG